MCDKQTSAGLRMERLFAFSLVGCAGKYSRNDKSNPKQKENRDVVIFAC